MQDRTLASFIEEVKRERERLAHAEMGKMVNISLTATGYPLHGDFAIEYDASYAYGETVSGTNLSEVVNELIRRNTFKDANEKLLIPYVKAEPRLVEDD